MRPFAPDIPGPYNHGVEIYTDGLYVHGILSGPFKRVTDLINRRDEDYLLVYEASVTPVGQAASPRKLATPVLVGRSHVHIIASSPGAGLQGQGEAAPREFYVPKMPVPCYALTDTFAVYGTAHLLQGSTLDSFLRVGDTFVPITGATIYLNTMPGTPWQRQLVVLNKAKVQVMYVLDAEHQPGTHAAGAGHAGGQSAVQGQGQDQGQGQTGARETAAEREAVGE
jgi:hypothetical protein